MCKIKYEYYLLNKIHFLYRLIIINCNPFTVSIRLIESKVVILIFIIIDSYLLIIYNYLLFEQEHDEYPMTFEKHAH